MKFEQDATDGAAAAAAAAAATTADKKGGQRGCRTLRLDALRSLCNQRHWQRVYSILREAMSKLDATSLARQVMNEAMAVSRLIADLMANHVPVHKEKGWGHVCAWLCSTVIVMQRVLDMDQSMETEFAKRLLLLSQAVAKTRFAFEEYGIVPAAQRGVQRNSHCVAVEQEMGWVVHRGPRTHTHAREHTHARARAPCAAVIPL